MIEAIVMFNIPFSYYPYKHLDYKTLKRDIYLSVYRYINEVITFIQVISIIDEIYNINEELRLDIYKRLDELSIYSSLLQNDNILYYDLDILLLKNSFMIRLRPLEGVNNVSI